MDREKTICSCFGITAGEIEDAVKNGATTFEEVQDATNAGAGCGACISEVTELIEELTK